MSKQFTVTENKSKDKLHRVSCIKCQVVTNHKVVLSVDEDTEWSSPDYEYAANESFQIIQCQGCNSFSFRQESSNSEDMEQTGDGSWETEVREYVFPQRRKRRPSLPDANVLPFKVRNIYEETDLAINNAQPILAGIGIRALVEAVCKNRNATGSLNQMINHLVQLNDLRQVEADILHKLRFMGNEAAHEAKPHSLESLSLAFDIVEHLLVTVYLLEERARHLF